jgi:hypothetical protein
VDPAWSAFFVAAAASYPAHFGGYAAAVGKGGNESVSHASGATDAIEERGLEDSWDAERGRAEEDPE